MELCCKAISSLTWTDAQASARNNIHTLLSVYCPDNDLGDAGHQHPAWSHAGQAPAVGKSCPHPASAACSPEPQGQVCACSSTAHPSAIPSLAWHAQSCGSNGTFCTGESLCCTNLNSSSKGASTIFEILLLRTHLQEKVQQSVPLL